MELGFTSLTVGQDDHDQYSPENSQDSPSSGVFNDNKTISSSSHKRSRRSLRKRVVSVPVKEIQGSRLKSEINAPPSDSWSWRKYGQKPIKGSPYPRSYYRCSSSKGCPARKQVERNQADPTMVIVTYSCDHNHLWSASRTNNKNHHNNSTQEQDSPTLSKQSIQEHEFTNQFGYDHQFGWFSDLESSSSNLLECPLLTGDIVSDADMGMIFSIREEEESLFADLGELPECAMVFGRREMMKEEENNRRGCSLAPW